MPTGRRSAASTPTRASHSKNSSSNSSNSRSSSSSSNSRSSGSLLRPSKGALVLYLFAIVSGLVFVSLFEQQAAFQTFHTLFGLNVDDDLSRNGNTNNNNIINADGRPKDVLTGIKPKKPREHTFVFVGGLQRSGTTLLSRVLDSPSWTSKMQLKSQPAVRKQQLANVAELQHKSVAEIQGIFKEGMWFAM